MTRLARRLAVAAALGSVLCAGCSTDPERAKVEYVKSGDRYAEQKQYGEAIVQYRNALQQDPKYGEAHYKLAQAFEHVGQIRSAGQEYRPRSRRDAVECRRPGQGCAGTCC